jgi:hypothetical protein
MEPSSSRSSTTTAEWAEPCRELALIEGLKALSEMTNQRQDGHVRYEPTMRPESGGPQLFDRVGAVMNEIAALLDERSNRDSLKARGALVEAYRTAAERRRKRRNQDASSSITSSRP